MVSRRFWVWGLPPWGACLNPPTVGGGPASLLWGRAHSPIWLLGLAWLAVARFGLAWLGRIAFIILYLAYWRGVFYHDSYRVSY